MWPSWWHVHKRSDRSVRRHCCKRQSISCRRGRDGQDYVTEGGGSGRMDNAKLALAHPGKRGKIIRYLRIPDLPLKLIFVKGHGLYVARDGVDENIASVILRILSEDRFFAGL